MHVIYYLSPALHYGILHSLCCCLWNAETPVCHSGRQDDHSSPDSRFFSIWSWVLGRGWAEGQGLGSGYGQGLKGPKGWRRKPCGLLEVVWRQRYWLVSEWAVYWSFSVALNERASSGIPLPVVGSGDGGGGLSGHPPKTQTTQTVSNQTWPNAVV